MCGIAGAYNQTLADNTCDIIAGILREQYQRGPDHQSLFTIARQPREIVFGHNRLSIVDLSAESNQPMWDTTGRFCIVYNGEIYNYIELRNQLKEQGSFFNTNSDTEVILNAFAAWGIDALQRFNGPFAFALYDKLNQTMWLCRDRFGVKPFFYYENQQSFYFASLPNALAKQFKLSPNLDYVVRGLKYWVYEDDTDMAPFDGVKALPAAHYLKITPDKKELIRYYDLAERVERLSHTLCGQNVESLSEQCAKLLHFATQIRLRADVPIGVTLSGGLDSSAVAAIASMLYPNTVGFTFGHSDASKSEGPLVAELAKQLNLNVTYVWPEPKDFNAILNKVIETQGSPFAGPSIIAQYLVYEAARKAGVKVLLGGQGGDEIFMGYRKFNWFWLQELLHKKAYGKALNFMFQLLPMFIAETKNLANYWQQRQRYHSDAAVKSIINLPSDPTNLRLGYEPSATLTVRQIADITTFSLPTLLRYEDRNSLGNSVEGRLPFMDYSVVEFGCALPLALKLNKGYGKWIIRQMMANKVPDSIRMARYKRGFDVDMNTFLRAGLGEKLRKELNERYFKIKNLIQPNVNINDAFSDQNFRQQRNTFAEAVSLIWLGNFQ